MLLALGSIALVIVTKRPEDRDCRGRGGFCIVSAFSASFFWKRSCSFLSFEWFSIVAFSWRASWFPIKVSVFHYARVQNDIFQLKWLYLKPDRYILKTRYGKLPVLFFEDRYIFIMVISMISITAGKYVMCVCVVWCGVCVRVCVCVVCGSTFFTKGITPS